MNNPISGRKILEPLRDKGTIVLAANIQVPFSAKGIMLAAKEVNAPVIFECAMSEHGYTDRTPEDFVSMIKKAVEETGFDLPYAIHADHVTVKGKNIEEVRESENSARELIMAQLKAGFTSYAIDASHLFNMEGKTCFEQLIKNIETTTKLASFIPNEFSLEVEVGEIGKIDPSTGKPELTTVDEAVTFIKSLNDNGIYPALLAINNGTSHGYNYDAEGKIIEQIGIDLERTKEIASAIRLFGVAITQHGITGTPLELMHKLIQAGILKGNVATLWREIAMENYPPELRRRMEEWTLESKYAKEYLSKKPKSSRQEVIGKNIKYAQKPFKKEIESMPEKYQEKIIQATKKSAIEFFEAFNARGTARFIKI